MPVDWSARVCLLTAVLVAAGLPDVTGAQQPRHTAPIQVTADGAFTWVVNSDSDSVAKIDTSTESRVGEFAVGDNPRTLALHDANGWLYVANQGSLDLTPKPSPDTVMRLDQATGTVQHTYSLPFGCAPYGVLVRESASPTQIYVSCQRMQRIIVLDESLSTSPLASVALGWPDPRGMVLSADGSRLYVAHFLTREPGSTAHVTEIDTTSDPPQVLRVFELPADTETCETTGSAPGVLNTLGGINIIPPGAPAEVAGQLWVGGTLENNLAKGHFLRSEVFGGSAKPLVCEGGKNDGQRCESDEDCSRGECVATPLALSRNRYRSAFHDIVRSVIFKIDLASGDVVGKIDLAGGSQATDIAFSADGTVAYTVDKFFNSLHIFNTQRGQGGNASSLFTAVPDKGPGGANPTSLCTGDPFDTTAEDPFILSPQVQIVPSADDPLFVGGTPASTGNDYLVTSGQMQLVPDGVGTLPLGVAVHPTGDRVYVANFHSRNVTVVKTDTFFCPPPGNEPCQTGLDCAGCVPRVVAVAPTIVPGTDPLPPQLLDGKILFHTAARDSSVANGVGALKAMPRFNLDDPNVLEPVGLVTNTSNAGSGLACGTCHPEAGFDGRSWDVSQFGGTLRNVMDLRGRAAFAPGLCSDPPAQPCTTNAECADNGVGTCSNDPNALCEVDVQCGSCAAGSPSQGEFCIADLQCGSGFECETTSCNAAKCQPASVSDIPKNIIATERFFNPMGTIHWNGDRDEVEDFEFTYRALMGGSDCDTNEHLPDVCLGGLLLRGTVAKPQAPNGGLADTNRGLSPRLDHMADYVYSLTSFPRNPNLPPGGPSSDAQAGREIFNSSFTRCAECHNGPTPENQQFTDKRPLASHPSGVPGGAASNNPFLRHNVGTFNDFDLADPFQVAADIDQFHNPVAGIPGSRGQLIDYVTPAIVDVWNTAPYNHDGTFATLIQALVPCNQGIDDCENPDSGKNFNNQHGTTSVLTPQQVRQLAEFLKAPHGPVGLGLAIVPTATAFTLLRRVKINFRKLEISDDDRFDIKATVTFPAGFMLDLVPGISPKGKEVTVLNETVKITLADVDEALIERTIPAGSLIANSKQTKFRFRDRTGTIVPGIQKFELKLLKTGPRDYRIKVKARDMDLSILDKNHITVSVEIGDDSFVKTRTFEANSKRSRLKVRER